jgi:hypothetical protein
MAGLVGGYLLAQVLSVALVAPWALPRADALLVAMQLSFGVYAVAAMGAFAARTARRAWVVMGTVTMLSGACAWVAL